MCRDVYVYIAVYLSVHLLTMAIFMQDNSAVLYALLRLRGEAKALKLEKKLSMKRLSWLLMGFGK